MARKSKDTILREKLELISACPFDIFEVVGEDALPLIERCEGGDVSVCEELCSAAYAALPRERRCEGLVYLLELGVGGGSLVCAELAIKYIAERELVPELAAASLELLPTLDVDGRRVVAMLTIDCEWSEVDPLDLLPEGEFTAVWIYVLHRRSDLGVVRARQLCARIGVPSLPALLNGESVLHGGREEQVRIFDILNSYPDERWQSFWLARLYEHAMASGGVAPIAPMLVDVFARRSYSERGALHTLAAAYIASREDPEYMTLVRELYEVCRFTGFTPDEFSLAAMVREGVYLDVTEQLRLAEERALLGGVIEHVKNRYVLIHQLGGRDKRARKHHWQTVISIEAEVMPQFGEITVEEIRHRAKRGEGELARDSSRCQILCRSEITFGERRHPFELDLYIDLSYVSATKCQNAEIRVTESERNGEYVTMTCDFYLK